MMIGGQFGVLIAGRIVWATIILSYARTSQITRISNLVAIGIVTPTDSANKPAFPLQRDWRTSNNETKGIVLRRQRMRIGKRKDRTKLKSTLHRGVLVITEPEETPRDVFGLLEHRTRIRKRRNKRCNKIPYFCCKEQGIEHGFSHPEHRKKIRKNAIAQQNAVHSVLV